MSNAENKTKQKPQQGGGFMGGRGGGGMASGEKPKDLKNTFRQLLAYLGKYKAGIILCLVLAAGATVISVFAPKITAGATDELFRGLSRMITGTGGIDFTIVLNILFKAGAIYLLSSALQGIQGFILSDVANKVSFSMRDELSKKINRLPLSYFDRVNHGEILSRVTNDVDTVTNTLSQSLSQMVISITSIIGALVMMFTIDIWMTLITILVLPLSGLLVSLVVKKSQPYYQEQQELLGTANSQVEEMYGGHLVVKAFNREGESLKTFTKINERLFSSAWKSQFFGNLMMPLMTFVGNIGYVAVCIVGGLRVLSGNISVGDIQAFIQYVRNFTQPVAQIANISSVLQQTAAAAERVFEFLAEEEETPDTEHPISPSEVDGSVLFAHVNFGYLPEKTIVNDFSAIIGQGKSVAIVGPTGAGKTTMVKLLMRFYDVNDGAILIDGYDLKQFARNDLRSMFGMVLQDTWLYNDTIMENIRYGRLDASDEEVIAAAKAAQAHHFIRTLPGGYNMVLNEEASNISQGQKQLLTIARTILSNPKILILDEATSSVDTRTEMSIQKAMGVLMQGRTSFVIAHRLSTIRDADMILVMRDGDIVETGTHDGLLSQNGFYAELYNSQFETGLSA